MQCEDKKCEGRIVRAVELQNSFEHRYGKLFGGDKKEAKSRLRLCSGDSCKSGGVVKEWTRLGGGHVGTQSP